MNSDELRKLDYEKTLEYVNQLGEIRFKLLALLPIATGAALGLAEPEKYPLSGLFLGLLGFFVTVGLLFYDQRNTEIYEKQMQRARLLELQLKFPPTTPHDDIAGGPVGGRPKRSRKLFRSIEIWHDRGLAFIYSAVLAVWSYLISASAVSLISSFTGVFRMAIPLAVPAGVAIFCWFELHKLDTPSGEVKLLKKEISDLEVLDRSTR